MDAHGEEVLCAGFDVEIHEVVGIPAGGFEERDEVFVAELRGVTVGFDVVAVLAGVLDVHVAGVPVAKFNAGLRTPMRPDAELGVVEPGREAVGLEGRGGSFEGAWRDGDLALLGVSGAEGGSCGGEESDGLATSDAHGWRVVLLRRLCTGPM